MHVGICRAVYFKYLFPVKGLASQPFWKGFMSGNPTSMDDFATYCMGGEL